MYYIKQAIRLEITSECTFNDALSSVVKDVRPVAMLPEKPKEDEPRGRKRGWDGHGNDGMPCRIVGDDVSVPSSICLCRRRSSLQEQELAIL